MKRYDDGRRRGREDLVLILVVTLGLSTLALPRIVAAHERDKALEAFRFLQTVQEAQELYRVRNGAYAATMSELGLKLIEPKYFDFDEINGWHGYEDPRKAWELRLTRKTAPFGGSRYWVTFDSNGYNSVQSSVPTSLFPVEALELTR